jgi:uncharacterized protein
MNDFTTTPQLKPWQWGVLAVPLLLVVGFILVAASLQIHQWGLNWIWAIFLVMFVGWRWVLARWLKSPLLKQAEAAIAELSSSPEQTRDSEPAQPSQRQQAETVVRNLLLTTQSDAPPWENWILFWQRCQSLIEAIARIYAPQAKHPLLNIYLPQAYGLIRGTVDDMDRWMQQLSPLLGQVTVGQAYEGYQTYQRLEPTARQVLKVWNWARWVFNPVAALARTATQGMNQQATEELLVNFGQIVREATLKALGEQAIALYSGDVPQGISFPEAIPTAAPTPYTESLQEILETAAQRHSPAENPLNIFLIGRTGAGKSSLINSLFRQDLAKVDSLPSTDALNCYALKDFTDDQLNLWDTPGYEQIGVDAQSRTQVLTEASAADVVILVTPATDPTLQTDLDFLEALASRTEKVPIVAVVTQVDRLRPLREWEPPYDWQTGDRLKERNIREAVEYRQSLLTPHCGTVLPIVTGDSVQLRIGWGISELSTAILAQIDPVKQQKLSRFLQDLNVRIQETQRVIDRYVLQMGTQQGIAALIKTPLLRFLSVRFTGSQELGIFLNQQIPFEKSPILLGRLQMAYELFALLTENPNPLQFQLQLPRLWPVLIQISPALEQDTWALGQTLVEYWTEQITAEKLLHRYQVYQRLQEKTAKSISGTLHLSE